MIAVPSALIGLFLFGVAWLERRRRLAEGVSRVRGQVRADDTMPERPGRYLAIHPADGRAGADEPAGQVRLPTAASTFPLVTNGWYDVYFNGTRMLSFEPLDNA